MGEFIVSAANEMASYVFNTFLQIGRKESFTRCTGLGKVLKEQNRYVCSGGVKMSTGAAVSAEPDTKTAKMSKAMRSYLARTQAHNEFMSEQIADFEIGKRHLANMMGEDPE